MGISPCKIWFFPVAGALPWAFGPWLQDGYVLPKLALASALTLLAAMNLAWTGRLFSIGSRIDNPLLGFCAVALLSALQSVDARLSWFGHYKDYLFSITGLAACLCAFYVGCAIGISSSMLAWLAAGSVPVSAYALLQWFGWEPFLNIPSLPVGGRAFSSFGSPVSSGAYFALVLPMALYLASTSQALKNHHRLIGKIALLLGLGALAASGSRGSWLGAFCGLAAFWALYARSNRKVLELGRTEQRKSFIGACALAASFFFAAAFWRAQADWRGSDVGRWEMWRIAWAEWRDQPWLGSGPDTYLMGFRRRKSERLAKIYSQNGAQIHAHNDGMQILATLGLAGFAMYLWLHIAALREAARALKQDKTGLLAAVCCGLIAVWVHAKFNSPSFAVAWLAAGLAGCVFAEPSARPRRLRIAPLLFALSLAWALGSSARALAADRQDLLGVRARRRGLMQEASKHLERAIALSPETTAYRFDLANLLWDNASHAPAPGRRLLLARATEVAHEGLRVRPLDADLYRLLGLAELRRFQWGGENRLEQARAALEQAEVLDPHFGFTLEALAQVAVLQGDKMKQRRVERILSKMRY